MRWLISTLAVLTCLLATATASAATRMSSAWAVDDTLDATVKQTCPADKVRLYYRITFVDTGETIVNAKGTPFPNPCRPAMKHVIRQKQRGLEWRWWTADKAHHKGAKHLRNRRFSGVYLITAKRTVKVYIGVVTDGDVLVERRATLRPK